MLSVRPMANLNIAMLGSQGYAKELGKIGTSTDITFYNLKRGDNTVTFIEPTKYPERLAPLFFATSLAKKAILVVENIDSTFGECAIMLQCLGVKEGYIVLRNYLTPEELKPLVKGTILENYPFLEDDPIEIRERLLKEAGCLENEPPSQEVPSCGSIPVDHFFNVKGIGAVILGLVSDGVLRKHNHLKLLPNEITVQVRSIQKHDDDFDWVCKGERAGLALKNVDVSELDRGVVLSSDQSIKGESSICARAELVEYWPHPIEEGMVLHLGHWMQFLPTRVMAVQNNGDWHRPTLTLELDKPLIFLPGDHAVIHYLEGGKLRVAGSLELN
jgi:selenocysteine-specific translation elongation factor